MFRPTTAAEGWEPAPEEIRAQDVTLQGDIHAWWCPTANWRPEDGAVLYCHGNAGNLSFRAEGVKRWQDRLRLPSLIFDYPGYGKSPGVPTEANCYAAARAGYDWLRGKGVRGDEIVLYGGSLGVAIAIELGRQLPYRALVLVSGFTSIPDMAALQFPWLPIRRLLHHRFDNLAKIADCPGRVFIAHGTADHMIPFRHGELLFEKAREPKEFFAQEGYDHNNAPGPEFYDRVAAFLHRYLASG